MAKDELRVALVHEVFFGEGADERLRRMLERAAGEGAELALLPELPLMPWVAATREPRDEDAEPPDGPLERRLAEAARACGIAVQGGVLVRDPAGGPRHNRAFLHDADGRRLADYDKIHLPCEAGYWESDHYRPGTRPPLACDLAGWPVGLQLCSDMNRPEGVLQLGAQGAALICGPRCTPAASYRRWRTVLRADALVSAAYVISVNRPRPESGVPIGGPSIAIGPDGEPLLESTEPLALVTLRRDALERAAADYPGYLDYHPELYARAWSALASGTAKSRDDA